MTKHPLVIWSAEKKLKKEIRFRLAQWQLYVLLLPAVTFVLLFCYKPMYGILIAFKDFRLKAGIMGSPWCGFDNFIRFFNSSWFGIILSNTLTLSILTLVVGFPVPVLVALLFNEMRSEHTKRFVQTVSYAPHFISTVVMCSMITMFLNPTYGVINQLLKLIYLEPVYFLQEDGLFKWVYVLSDIWQNAGWNSIIYVAALSGIDSQILEAADIDGASRLQKNIYINLPSLVPTFVVLFILQCGQILSVGYEKVFLLQTDANLYESEIISTYVYKIGLERSDFSFSTAAGVFNSVVNSIVLIGANVFSKKVVKVGLW